jgi:glycerol uptake facilitator protein
MADITPLAFRGEGRTVGRITGLWGELLSEFFGTFVLIAFGDGVVAMAVAALPGSGRTAGPTVIFQAAGDWLLITWGWAMAVAFAVWVAGGVSGAHINPAVTLAFAVRRKFAWNKVLPYWVAQIAGAFVGAALVFLVYFNSIDAFNIAAKTPRSSGSALATYSIFATFPAKYFGGGLAGPLIDQIVGTAFLLIFVVAVIDIRNAAVQSNLARTRATRSTRPATSAPGCSPSSPAGARWPSPAPTTRAVSPSATTSGYRSWGRSSAPSSASSCMTCSLATCCTPGSS